MFKRDKATSPVETLMRQKMRIFQGGQPQLCSWIEVLRWRDMAYPTGYCIPINVYKGFWRYCRLLAARRKIVNNFLIKSAERC